MPVLSLQGHSRALRNRCCKVTPSQRTTGEPLRCSFSSAGIADSNAKVLVAIVSRSEQQDSPREQNLSREGSRAVSAGYLQSFNSHIMYLDDWGLLMDQICQASKDAHDPQSSTGNREQAIGPV